MFKSGREISKEHELAECVILYNLPKIKEVKEAIVYKRKTKNETMPETIRLFEKSSFAAKHFPYQTDFPLMQRKDQLKHLLLRSTLKHSVLVWF